MTYVIVTNFYSKNVHIILMHSFSTAYTCMYIIDAKTKEITEIRWPWAVAFRV